MSEGGKTPRTRMLFPFEVEMWSFGVTIYQCSTGSSLSHFILIFNPSLQVEFHFFHTKVHEMIETPCERFSPKFHLDTSPVRRQTEEN